MSDLPHFAFPFERPANSKVKVVEQDTVEHVAACENVILACPVGFRQERPDFGIPWPEYRAIRGGSRATADPGAIEEAVRRLEPRGLSSVADLTTRAQAAIGEVEIEVTVEA